MDQRLQELRTWLQSRYPQATLEPIVGDASFRRYFRLSDGARRLIVMDAPPTVEPCQAFIDLARAYRATGLRTPEIFDYDISQGFVVLEDFGNHLFYKILSPDNVDRLYGNAISKLPAIQRVINIAHQPLAPFGQIMMQKELHFFTQWFLEKYLKMTIDAKLQKILEHTYGLLIEQALAQPQVGIHRDYHSRNLMELPHQEVGILDFQDAMRGPLTYDLASLIRDCYVDWPHAQVYEWLRDFQKQLSFEVSSEQLEKWFDFMGMQRHLKAIFIFARKYLRDGEPLYLQFIPRALGYVAYVVAKYPELRDFQTVLDEVAARS